MGKVNWKRLGRKIEPLTRNAPLYVLGSAVIVALETYSAGGIFQVTTEIVTILGLSIVLAMVEAVVSLGCGLLAFWGSMACEAFKNDARASQRNRAFGARLLSLALLVVPVTYLGNAFAYQKQLGEWREFAGSEAERGYQVVLNNPMADSMAVREAAFALEKSNKPATVEFDFLCWLGAAFLHGSVMLAGGLFWRPRRETDAEAQRRRQAVQARAVAEKKAAAVAKGQATREANRKAEATLNKKLAREAGKARGFRLVEAVRS